MQDVNVCHAVETRMMSPLYVILMSLEQSLGADFADAGVERSSRMASNTRNLLPTYISLPTLVSKSSINEP